ncbi:MAG: hypothetical protein GC205_10890 [Bacteroidetes bacterium]|nr:hypothetical protein [Bacteroidota bacterium]
MTTIHEAYNLVQSLEHNELRYVSWFMKRRSSASDKNDVVLLKLLTDLPTYDESQLEDQLSQHQSLKKFTASSVSRLTKGILKALRSFREESSIELTLRNMLEDDSILKERLIYGAREKLLNKLYAKASAYELYDVLLEVLDRQILQYLSSKSDDILIHEKLILFEQTTKAKDYLGRLQILYYRFFTIYRMGSILTQEELDRHEEAFALLSSEQDIHGDKFFIKNIYLNTAAMLQLLIGNKAMVYQLRYDQVLWWEAHPAMQEYRLTNYKMVLANYLVASFEVGNFLNFPATLQKFRDLPILSLDDEGEVFQNVTFLELVLFLNQDRFEEALALIPVIESGLLRYGKKVNDARKMAFSYNIMIVYFELADYERCIDWINRVRQFKTAHRADIQARVFLLELVAHYSLQNSMILESLLRNTRRRFQKENRFSVYEDGLFKRFRALILSGPDKKEKALDQLNHFLVNYESDVKGEQSYCREELSRWVNRTINPKKKPR